MSIAIEKYPIVIQVIQGSLCVHSPDFDLRIAEPYEPKRVGQTELLVRKMRLEILRRVHFKKLDGQEIPSPKSASSQTHEDARDLISGKEVAKILGCTRQTIWRLSRAGELKSYKTPRGQNRFKRSEIKPF